MSTSDDISAGDYKNGNRRVFDGSQVDAAPCK